MDVGETRIGLIGAGMVVMAPVGREILAGCANFTGPLGTRGDCRPLVAMAGVVGIGTGAVVGISETTGVTFSGTGLGGTSTFITLPFRDSIGRGSS